MDSVVPGEVGIGLGIAEIVDRDDADLVGAYWKALLERDRDRIAALVEGARMFRPMRPKPLMPTLIVMSVPLCVVESGPVERELSFRRVVGSWFVGRISEA